MIRSFDGHALQDGTQLPWLVSSAGVGHRARVEVLRADDNGAQRPLNLDVTLTAMPEPAQAPPQMVPMMPGMAPGMVPIP